MALRVHQDLTDGARDHHERARREAGAPDWFPARRARRKSGISADDATASDPEAPLVCRALSGPRGAGGIVTPQGAETRKAASRPAARSRTRRD